MSDSLDRRALAAAGFVAGVAAGVLVWSGHMRRSRQNLFGASVLERFAALGHLAGQPSVETVRLLRDYVRWERHALLRRRGERALRKVERSLRHQNYHQ